MTRRRYQSKVGERGVDSSGPRCHVTGAKNSITGEPDIGAAYKAVWIPHFLNLDQKRNHIRVSKALLKRYEEEGDRFLDQIVTGDESWCYHYDPSTKRASMEWKRGDSPRPKKKIRSQRSADLAPSDYFLFGLLKKELKGKRFDSDEDVQKVVQDFFHTLPKSAYKEGIYKLPERWRRCIESQGQPIEKGHVTPFDQWERRQVLVLNREARIVSLRLALNKRSQDITDSPRPKSRQDSGRQGTSKQIDHCLYRKMEQGREEDSKEPIKSDPDYESGENTTFPKKETTLGRTQEIVPSQEDVTPPPPVSDVLGRLTTTLHQLSAVTGHREMWNYHATMVRTRRRASSPTTTPKQIGPNYNTLQD
ncbi:hypothetical protein LAZ67_22000044 [Cordylochernes scorpioides]|uniref:Histone-lysine N-methyltransferase SETMAR n=1 Tax=Cordylochernes scorpioides TaxID=51811 RepID=A0ABY6LNE0_9ARAC|nr:hypothetical protein LAZ67_22000044 [Cordylochernes scorpioides]